MRALIRVAALTATGSAATIAAGAVKTKLIATFLGPGGLGQFGLLLAGLTIIVAIFGLGLSSTAVRAIAAADFPAIYNIRNSLNTTTKLLALPASVAGYATATLAVQLSGTGAQSPIYYILFALSCALSVASIGPVADLNGRRRTSDITRLYVIVAIGSVLTALPIVTFTGPVAPSALLFVSTFITFCTATVLSERFHGRTVVTDRGWRNLLRTAMPLVRAGFFLSVAAIATSGSQFVARSFLTAEFGVTGNGLFQAAWTISSAYIGFVMSALVIDYYPRLSSLGDDIAVMHRTAQQQSQHTLLLVTPIILVVEIFVPEIVSVLYSDAFIVTSDILRWQLIGDIIKVFAWTIAFILLSSNATFEFLICEFVWNASFLALLVLAAPIIGLRYTGIIYVVSYFVYALAIIGTVRYKTGYLPAIPELAIVSLGLVSGLSSAALFTGGNQPRILAALPAAGGAITLILLFVSTIISGSGRRAAIVSPAISQQKQ